MDNLSSHKVNGIKEAVEKVGAEVKYFPPYSPDLNPIEQVFAKLKNLMRKAAAREVQTLWCKLAESLNAFTINECKNYISNAGYCL